jgi:alkylation response protein AidB-like acyl-CoA dehydrogenase
MEKEKDQWLADKKLTGRAAVKEMAKKQAKAMELVKLNSLPVGERDFQQVAELESDLMVRYALLDSQANVFCPACKLWNTGHGANMMREAVSLMGGYGITEDCPGFLGQKWMDAQLEATYEGPEAVQRLQLSMTMTNDLFLAQFQQWITDMRRLAGQRPGTGACTLASAMQLWLWTLRHVLAATDADGAKLFHKTRQGVTFPLADALCWLLAGRQFILDVAELEIQGARNPAVAEGLAGTVGFFNDLAHVQCARAAGEVSRITAEIVFGYNRHPAWDETSCHACYRADELSSLESLIPGIEGSARAYSDVAEAGEEHPCKAGPCVNFHGLESYLRLRAKLDGCLTGCRLAKDRAAESLTRVMTREALDYPV